MMSNDVRIVECICSTAIIINRIGLIMCLLVIQECDYYHGKCSNGTVDYKIGHVANQVGSEANVEKHVEDGENLLPCVLCMQVAIPSCCEGDD